MLWQVLVIAVEVVDAQLVGALQGGDGDAIYYFTGAFVEPDSLSQKLYFCCHLWEVFQKSVFVVAVGTVL